MIWLFFLHWQYIWYKIILLWRFNNSQGQHGSKMISSQQVSALATKTNDAKCTPWEWHIALSTKACPWPLPLRNVETAHQGFSKWFSSHRGWAWRKAGCKQGLSYSANQQSVSSMDFILFHTTHKTPTLQQITKKKQTNSFRPKGRVLHLKSIASR